MTKEEAIELAKEIVEEMTFEDTSVGLNAIGSFTKEFVEGLKNEIEGFEVLEHDDTHLKFEVEGQVVEISLKVTYMDTPWGRDCDTEWVIQ